MEVSSDLHFVEVPNLIYPLLVERITFSGCCNVTITEVVADIIEPLLTPSYRTKGYSIFTQLGSTNAFLWEGGSVLHSSRAASAS